VLHRVEAGTNTSMADRQPTHTILATYCSLVLCAVMYATPLRTTYSTTPLPMTQFNKRYVVKLYKRHRNRSSSDNSIGMDSVIDICVNVSDFACRVLRRTL